MPSKAPPDDPRRLAALLALADAMTAVWLDRAGAVFAGLSLAFALIVLFFL